MLWYTTRFAAQIDFFGGVRVIDTAHVLIFIFLVFFVIIHVYLATLGSHPDGAFQGDADRL